MNREDILKALRLCTRTGLHEDCSHECPYFEQIGCIHALLDDTFEMLTRREA